MSSSSPTSEPKQWTWNPTRLDRGDQRGMGIEGPMAANLALQAQLFPIGREEELDRSSVEADAVVEPADAVWRVETLDPRASPSESGFR